MHRRHVVLVGAALCGAVVAQTTGLKPVTMQGDVTLTRSVMSIPGMPDMDSGTVTATFRRVRGGSGAGQVPEACVVTRASAGQASPGGSAIGGGTEDVSVDAGDPITVRYAQSPYATLKRQTVGKNITYQAATPVPAPTAALVVDVPGAAGGFPAFRAAAFPSSAGLKLTAPKDGAVSLETKFTWSNPTNDAATHVMIVGSDERAQLAFVCTARDDGAFAFPEASRAELKRLGFRSGTLTMVGRQGTRVHRVADAQLNVHVLTIQAIMPADESESDTEEQE